MNAKIKLRPFLTQHDNHPFKAGKFIKSLDLTKQTITLSTVGARKKNGVAEWMIQTLSWWVRAMLLLAVFLLHWPHAANLELCW